MPTKTKRVGTKAKRTPGLLERLAAGPVICAEGYLFEFERRGYLQAGAYVPEVVLEHPELVEGLHRDFVRAGSDVVEAFTYYAHRAKLRIVGREGDLAKMNRTALRIAKKVARSTGTLLAGDICNTSIYDPADAKAQRQASRIFDEQVAWACREMDARESPVALLVPPPGVVAAGAEAAGATGPRGTRARAPGGWAPAGLAAAAATLAGTSPVASASAATTASVANDALRPAISRRDALAVAIKELGDEPVIHAAANLDTAMPRFAASAITSVRVLVVTALIDPYRDLSPAPRLCSLHPRARAE